MQKDETDLRERTKNFALRIVQMFSTLPKTTEAQVLGSNYCDPELLLGQTTEKRTAVEAKRSSSRNVVTACAKSKKLRIGSNCSLLRTSSRPTDFNRFARSATSSQQSLWPS